MLFFKQWNKVLYLYMNHIWILSWFFNKNTRNSLTCPLILDFKNILIMFGLYCLHFLTLNESHFETIMTIFHTSYNVVYKQQLNQFFFIVFTNYINKLQDLESWQPHSSSGSPVVHSQRLVSAEIRGHHLRHHRFLI